MYNVRFQENIEFNGKRAFIDECSYLGVIPPMLSKVEYDDVLNTWYFSLDDNGTVSGDSPALAARNWAVSEGLVAGQPDEHYKSVLMSLL